MQAGGPPAGRPRHGEEFGSPRSPVAKTVRGEVGEVGRAPKAWEGFGILFQVKWELVGRFLGRALYATTWGSFQDLFGYHGEFGQDGRKKEAGRLVRG